MTSASTASLSVNKHCRRKPRSMLAWHQRSDEKNWIGCVDLVIGGLEYAREILVEDDDLDDLQK